MPHRLPFHISNHTHTHTCQCEHVKNFFLSCDACGCEAAQCRQGNCPTETGLASPNASPKTRRRTNAAGSANVAVSLNQRRGTASSTASDEGGGGAAKTSTPQQPPQQQKPASKPSHDSTLSSHAVTTHGVVPAGGDDGVGEAQGPMVAPPGYDAYSQGYVLS